jgi:pimeloyl-ACP methyl ester carboxylesterase
MDIDNNNIYILGRSLGGAVACHVASNAANRLKIKGVILENTFTSISDVATRKFYLLSKLIAPFLRNKWESINEIRSFACPILFIVGEIIVYLGKKD